MARAVPDRPLGKVSGLRQLLLAPPRRWSLNPPNFLSAVDISLQELHPVDVKSTVLKSLRSKCLHKQVMGSTNYLILSEE